MSSATDDIIDNVSANNSEPSTENTPEAEDLDVFVKELMDTSKLDCVYIAIHC